MPEQSDSRRLMRGILRGFQDSWKTLFLTAAAFKLISLAVLTPLLGVLLRSMMVISGRAFLSDVDILLFLVHPYGLACGCLFGASLLGIFALEQASLIAIVHARQTGQRLRPAAALRFAATQAWSVLRLTVRGVALTLLTVIPFVALAGAVYSALLTEYDINYYLQEQPPVFRWTLAIGTLIAVSLAIVLLRLFSGWFFALPLVLFEDVRSGDALKSSAARVRGHRWTIICSILVWTLAISVLSAIATAAVGGVGSLLIPESTNSLRWVTFTVGMTLLAWASANLAINFLGTTTFAAMLFVLYRVFGSNQGAENRHRAKIVLAEQNHGFQVTRKRILAAVVVLIVASSGLGVYSLGSLHLEDHVMIMAHRGASHAAPENTMAAFRQAIEEGADWIELDVQETADGEVVVLHDSDFMKLAGLNLKIWNATADDLKNIDVGSWFADEFQYERVPTLGEVLDVCKGKIGVNIELKYYGRDERLEQRVAEIVEARDMASDVMVMSLNSRGVKKMKSLRPNWKVGLLISVSAGNLQKIEADFLAVNARFANQRLIRSAHRIGREVYVWTVNDALTMSTMISHGVDGILTDKPALAKLVLEQRADMSPPERLLLELAGLLGTVSEIGEQ